MNKKEDKKTIVLAISLLVLIGLFFRFPLIGSDLPYFYDEDEAHHFNRTVEMVKKGEYNPQYFLKPSLHFYLRMPVVAASFLWTVKEGQIKSVQDIRTRDKFGIAGYSFTASHPGIVKWNRALSTFLSLGLIVFSFLIALDLFSSKTVAFTAGLLSAVSPALIEKSSEIGVNMPMAFFCLLTVYLAVKFAKRCASLKLSSDFSLPLLTAIGLFSGLTVSTKYNALPIALLPLFLCFLFRSKRSSHYLIALLTPALGFVAGSPYAFLSLPLFLDHLAYEIWHYGIAGHIGHTGKPGLSQTWYYFSWLASDGICLVPALLAWAGVIYVIAKKKSLSIVFLFFPVLYLILMSSQKANFTRNFLVMIPFAAILASSLVQALSKREKKLHSLISIGVIILIAAQPILLSMRKAQARSEQIDSRKTAFQWLNQNTDASIDTAISGKLQLPLFIFSHDGETDFIHKGISRINATKADFLDLYLMGFDRLVLGPERVPNQKELAYLTLEKKLNGTSEDLRIVKNPEIKIFRFNRGPQLKEVLFERVQTDPYYNLQFPLTQEKEQSYWSCPADLVESAAQANDNFCWLQKRLLKIELADLKKTARLANRGGIMEIQFEAMTPWTGQALVLLLPDYSQSFQFDDKRIGLWQKVSFPLPYKKALKFGGFDLQIDKIRSPQTQDITSSDSRRLGVAIKDLVISKRK